MIANLDSLLLDLRKLIAEKSGVPIEQIGVDTLLDRDLHIRGDDAVELLEAIERIYGLNWSGFNFADHFRPEPEVGRWTVLGILWFALLPFAFTYKVGLVLYLAGAVIFARKAWYEPLRKTQILNDLSVKDISEIVVAKKWAPNS